MKAHHHQKIKDHLVKAGYKKTHAAKMVNGMKQMAKEHGFVAEHEKKEMKHINALKKMHEKSPKKSHGHHKAEHHKEEHHGRGRLPKRSTTMY